MAANLKIYDLQAVIAEEKGVEKKHAAMRRALALMQFMVDNELIQFDPFYSNGELKRDLVIMLSDLTEDGRLFMQKEWPEWRAWVDRGGDPFKTDMLDRRLKALRDRHAAG